MSTGNTTCSGVAVSWATSDDGDTPCRAYERMIGICQDFSMFNTSLPSIVFSCTTGNPDSCCCSSVAFALFEACISCQWDVAPIKQAQNLSSWLNGCSDPAIGSIPDKIKGQKTFSIPRWALISPEEESETWNYAAASSAAIASSASRIASELLSTKTVLITVATETLTSTTIITPSSASATTTSLSTSTSTPLAASSPTATASSATSRGTTGSTSVTRTSSASTIQETASSSSAAEAAPAAQTSSATGEEMPQSAKRTGVLTGAVIGASLGLLVLSAFLVFLYRQNSRARRRQSMVVEKEQGRAPS